MLTIKTIDVMNLLDLESTWMIDVVKLGAANFQDYELYKWSSRNKKLKPINSFQM